MLRRLRIIISNQKGFTLIEMLIVIAITSLIGVGVTVAVNNVWNVNALSVSRVDAVKQVENAIYWMSRDTQMAQTVQESGGSGFPLTLTWVEWGSNTKNQVTYTLQYDELHRSEIIIINGAPGAPTDTVIADRLDPSAGMTWCDFDYGSRVLILHVTASVSGFREATETRECLVVPRSAF